MQGALLAGALIAVIAVPLILRHGTQPAAKTLLQRDYAAGFGLLLGLIAVIAAVHHLARVIRDRAARGNRRSPGRAGGESGSGSR